MLDLIRKLFGGGDRGAANDWRPAPSCSIYLRDDAVIVLTGRSTETGLGIAGEPVWRLDPSPDPAALTRAIHDALKASATAVPVALSEDVDLIPRTTGLRSWVAMERGAKHLSVRSEGGAFHLETWKPAGGGWEGDGSRTVNAPSAHGLGHEVLQLAASAAPRPPARVRRPRRYSAPQAPTDADVPVAFGYKTYWLTVASPDPRPVADALRLTDLRPLPWGDGYAAASDAFMDMAYVTPSVEGWVFAVFADVPENEDGLRAVLEPLSDRFDEAQAYVNVRTSSAYDGRAPKAAAWCARSVSVMAISG